MTISEHGSPSDGELKPNTDASIDFLKAFAPEGPWPPLTAIIPDGKTTTDTFGPETEEACRKWIDSHQGIRNVHFMVNPAMMALSSKAKKEHVREMRWLHVDIDPPPGVEPEQAKAAAIAKLEAFRPPPTCVIDSGGGVQAFWRLAEPMPVNGDVKRAEELEAYNQQLELLLGGDHCHNLDRIMRLPGTINVPNEKKRKKGRKPVLAKALVWEPSRVYSLEDFAPAPRAGRPTLKQPDDVATEIIPPSNPVGVDDLDLSRLSAAEQDKVAATILHGPTPELDFGGDRSGAVWFVLCRLAKAGVSRELAAGIILNPELGISAHVLEKGGRDAVKYAGRNVQRAYDEVEAGFQTDKAGTPYPSQHNIRVALTSLEVRLAHDEFARRSMIEWAGKGWATLSDSRVIKLWLEVERQHGFRPAKDYFFDVVDTLARENTFHPVRDYLDGLRWDGEERIGNWLTRYAGAEDTPYTRAVGRLALIAAVRRVRQPGCKFDEMLVLESAQGLNKSSALRALAVRDAWFDDDLPLNAKPQVVIEKLDGRWIVEAAELQGLNERSVEHLKALLSRQCDSARMSYGRIREDVPRQCIIVGTTNHDRYLLDGTGNRRFWPVRVGPFDVEALTRNRDMLWAEAAEAEARGESIRLSPELYPAAAAQQDERRLRDGWEDELRAQLGSQCGKITSAQLLDYLGVLSVQRDAKADRRLGEAMRAIGWTRRKLRWGGAPVHCYVSDPERPTELPWLTCREDDGHRRIAPEVKFSSRKQLEHTF